MMSTHEQRKAKIARDKVRAAMRDSIALAKRLRAEGAPKALIEDVEWAAYSAKIRLWGWTGEPPATPLTVQ